MSAMSAVSAVYTLHIFGAFWYKPGLTTKDGGNMTNYPYFIPQEKCESSLGRGGPIDSLLSLTTETKLELRFLA